MPTCFSALTRASSCSSDHTPESADTTAAAAGAADAAGAAAAAAAAAPAGAGAAVPLALLAFAGSLVPLLLAAVVASARIVMLTSVKALSLLSGSTSTSAALTVGFLRAALQSSCALNLQSAVQPRDAQTAAPYGTEALRCQALQPRWAASMSINCLIHAAPGAAAAS
jgi:hypothetical protein